MTDYGARLKAARQAAGRTQRELADACGISFTSISHIEHGRFLPGAYLAGVFADVLEADLSLPDELAALRARLAATEAERDALAAVIETGLLLHQCPLCAMRLVARGTFAHEPDCVLRDGVDPAKVVALYAEIRAHNDEVFAAFERKRAEGRAHDAGGEGQG